MARLRSARPASRWLLAVSICSLIAAVASTKEFKIRDQANEVQEAAGSSSSSQMMLVKPPNHALQAEKLHKFAYDISLSKRIREQQSAKAQEERERRKNDKPIKTNRTISSSSKQQVPTKSNKHQKRTTRVPSLFFDDDADIEQEQQQQQQQTTTTTVATDNLLVVYDKSHYRENNNSQSYTNNDNNNLLVTATEKYQPQVQTTLTSHTAIEEEAPPSYTIVRPPREQSYADTDARARDTTIGGGGDDDDDRQPPVRLKPILLTSGIKVRSELSFAPDEPDSTNPQQETRNLAASVVRQQSGNYNDLDSLRSKLRRTTDMAPTRLVFGANDENLPPELSLRQPQTAHNRMGSQHKRQGDNRIVIEDLDDEEDYSHDWLPPYKRTSGSSIRVKTSNFSGSSGSSGTKTAQLAQTSSSAIRVVASDDSVPLVMNSRGLITASKSAMRNKLPLQVAGVVAQVSGTSPRPFSASNSLHVPPPALIKRPPIATITQAPVQLFLSTSNSSSIVDDLVAPTTANATTEQNWSSFLPNPPYKQLNFTQTTPIVAPSTTTMRPATERRSTTTTKRPPWTMSDLSPASSQHQHATSAGDTLTTTASYGEPAADIWPALNNQSSSSAVAATIGGLKKPAQSYLRHKMQSILRQKLISSNKKQAALASNGTASQTSAIKLQMMPTPPPLLSSTVANNVASLLTQTLGSLIMRQQQQQPTTTTTISKGPHTGQRPVNKIRQRLGQVTKANAILNRRATSVGSLLFSGFIYGLSVLPALMAITGINPLSGSPETSQSPGRNSRKQSSSSNANQRKQASESSASASKIMLANLSPAAFPYLMPPVAFPPASLFTAAAPPNQPEGDVSSDQLTGFHSQDSPIDPQSTADALLQPTVHSADPQGYSTQQIGGSFSDLQPLVDEPTRQQHSDEPDMEHSQWHQSAASAPEPLSRRKVQRDLRNWHRSNYQDYDFHQNRYIYHQDKANSYRPSDSQDANSSDRHTGIDRPMSSGGGGGGGNQAVTPQEPTNRPMSSNSQVAATQFPAVADRATSHNTYLTATSYGSSGSQAAAAAAAAAAVAAQADRMGDPKYVSPAASQPSIPAPLWSPERGDSSNRIDTNRKQQARPIGAAAQQIHGQHQLKRQQQWQQNYNDYGNSFPTSASQSAGSSSLDFALLGPYEPIVATFQPTRSGHDEQPAVSSRARRTPPLAHPPTTNWPSAPSVAGDSKRLAKILQHPADAKSPSWSSSSGSRAVDGGSQWKAITQPVTSSDSSKVMLARKGAKKYKRRHQADRRKQYSNRLGDPLPAATPAGAGALVQASQFSDGPLVVLSRSMALSER